ncbi:MAG: hypothetical protein LKF96_04145 [Treponema sp.]|jgi:DNA-binding MurR/RpiR family transcriptional regulator|nr:hypothetical protein [Treponema sp.]
MEIIERTKEAYDGQSNVRKTISDYILSHTLQSCFFSLKEFSDAVEITEATAISYGKSLGFNSYLEMKKALQNYSMAEFSSQERLSMLSGQSSSFDGLFKRVERSEIGLLIAITMTPYGKPTFALAGVVKQSGMPVIAITDSNYSPGAVHEKVDELLSLCGLPPAADRYSTCDNA